MSSATFIAVDTTTRGSWTGVYGGDGYSIPQSSAVIQSLPSYISSLQILESAGSASRFDFANPSVDLDATDNPASPGTRIDCVYFDSSQVKVQVMFDTGTTTSRVALYFHDSDSEGRTDDITVDDYTDSTPLDSRSISSFISPGKWLVWDVVGTIRITVTKTGGFNPIVSAVTWATPPSGGTTYTGTGDLLAGSATLSGSATFTPPTYTGSGNLAAGSATLSASAAFTAPTYTATGGLTAGSATLSGSAEFATVVYLGSGDLAAGSATLSASATFTAPVYTGIGSLTASSATVSATATFTPPVYTGTGSLVAGSATLSASAVFSASVSIGTGVLLAGSATLSGLATFIAGESVGVIGAVWVALPGVRVWLAKAYSRLWQAIAGVRVWRAKMGLVSNEIKEEVLGSSTLRLAMDFGDLLELSEGAVLQSCAVVVESGTLAAVTVSSIRLENDYTASALFSGGEAGEYAVKWTPTLLLADTTTQTLPPRTATLKLV